MDFEDSSLSSSSNELSPSRSPLPSSSHAPAPLPKRKAGRKKFRETRHPVYRGVRQRNGGKWVCEVREPHKKSRIWLGTFPTPEMAARAHDVAAIALRGESAPLNFADSAWTLPRPRSASADDIRGAACKAAEMFRPSVSSAASVSSVSGAGERSERVVEAAPPRAVFVDEEAFFNMPGLLDDMAAGLLLTPPAMQKGFDWDGLEFHMDLSLWSD